MRKAALTFPSGKICLTCLASAHIDMYERISPTILQGGLNYVWL